MDISVGLVTHLDDTVDELLNQILSIGSKDHNIKEVIIVSSGFTEEIKDKITSLEKNEKRLKVIREKDRVGKTAAVNIFLKEARLPILIMSSGDILLEDDAIDELVKPLESDDVGMVGSKPVPSNDESSFIGYCVHLVWRTHHHLALINPKIGEFCAFKKVIDSIPEDTAVDEAWIEYQIREKGFKTAYAPKAIIHNMGPQNISDFIKQRMRVHIGHVMLKRRTGYGVASIRYKDIIMALIRSMSFSPKKLIFTFAAVILEVYIRIRANIELLGCKDEPVCWEIIKSAKHKSRKND